MLPLGNIILFVSLLAVQNPNVVKITDFGLAKLLDSNEDVFKAAGGKVSRLMHLKCVVCLLCELQSNAVSFFGRNTR